eukprot:747574-Hanusia_phi.AAC.11
MCDGSIGANHPQGVTADVGGPHRTFSSFPAMQAGADEEVDALLVNVAQRSGGIEPMLHSIFSFLKRRTDFYHIQKPGDKIGDETREILAIFDLRPLSGFPTGVAKRMVLQAFKHFEDDTELSAPKKEELEARGERLQNNSTSGAITTTRTEQVTSDQPPKPRKEHNAEVHKDPKKDDSKSNFVCYNGGECERYRWWKCALVGDQEIDTQRVDSTCVSNKTEASVDNSYFTSGKIDDYDEPTQAAIQKLMFDQQQKMQGLPTSDELKQQEILKKAWNAEGNSGPGMGPGMEPGKLT